MSKYDDLQRYLKNNQSTWLVTGAAGFIGSNLVEKLLTLNQKVVGLDNFETGYHHNLDQAVEESSMFSKMDLSNNFKFYEGDIRILNDCKKACSGVHYVLHQAALGSVPRSIEDPISTNNANINGFLNMLVASRDAKIRRFVYAASSSTYGDHPDLPKVEEKIGNPLSPYAVSKLVNELYAAVFAKNYGFQTIGLRYFNIFGKRQDRNGAYAAVIPTWVSNILNNEEIYINGDGKTSRDFCFIDNTIQMNLLAATTSNEKALDQIYNVALNDSTSLNRLFEMISKKIISKKNNLKVNQPIYRDFRSGDIKYSQADVKKAIKFLGYKPSHSIDQGLDEAMEWYCNN